MKAIKSTLLALAIAATPALAQDCEQPETPSIPDGATSAMEDMLAGQKAVKAFQAANIDYLACVEKAMAAAETAAKDAGNDDKAAAQKSYTDLLETYNAAVSTEEEVAGQFNTAIREYKAASAN
jgi:predicted dinucleotide-binding enzyme